MRQAAYVWVTSRSADRLCTLVMIGMRSDGTKELPALEDGYRESTESRASVLDGAAQVAGRITLHR